MVSSRRLVVWSGTDADRFEVADVAVTSDGLRATGTQIGVDPMPYRLDYVLDAPSGLVTRSLDVDVSGQGWSRRLRLRHDGDGGWTWETERSGAGPAGAPGADGTLGESLRPARDCDLGLSPLTNAMPVRRDGLHRSGSRDYVMAWVSVPDLALVAYPQRYEHVRRTPTGSVVRFVDLQPDVEFVSELVYDTDGLVVDYPGLARTATPPS